MSEDPAELWRAALEEHVRRMSDNEFQQLIARTRPPDYSTFTDPAQRMRAVTAGIAAQQAKQQRAQSEPQPSQADLDALREQIAAAEQSGDHTQAIALKQRLRPKVDANGYPIRTKGPQPE